MTDSVPEEFAGGTGWLLELGMVLSGANVDCGPDDGLDGEGEPDEDGVDRLGADMGGFDVDGAEMDGVEVVELVIVGMPTTAGVPVVIGTVVTANGCPVHGSTDTFITMVRGVR